MGRNTLLPRLVAEAPTRRSPDPTLATHTYIEATTLAQVMRSSAPFGTVVVAAAATWGGPVSMEDPEEGLRVA